MKPSIDHILTLPKTLFVFCLMCCGKARRQFRLYYASGGLSLCWNMGIFQVKKALYNRVLSHYDALMKENRTFSKRSHFLIQNFSRRPLISIVTPVYKVDPKWLDLCIRSVVNQQYPDWELILVDDGSKRPDLTELMDTWCRRDERIKAVGLEHNQGIAAATNAGFEKAAGEFIGILDHDDELTPDALVWVVWALNKNPQAKWLYSDEDLITPKGLCHSPFFKPDYSPENLLSRNYICHFRVYAADILRQIGGKRIGFDGAQDHDLALRYAEAIKPDQVVHIPRVLYHWRTIPTSAATTLQAKPKASEAGVRAVRQALKRRGAEAAVTCHPLAPTLYRIKFSPKEHPKVAIIISPSPRKQRLDQCLASMDRHTTYPNCQVIVINDTTGHADRTRIVKEAGFQIPIQIFDIDQEVSYAERRNRAADGLDAEIIVWMDDDIQVTASDWLSQLVGTMQMDPSIGAVGPLLLSPGGKIRHAGIILGAKEGVGIACRGMCGELPGDNCRAAAMQEYSALTGSLLCVSRAAFQSAGGFDSQGFPQAYSEIDLCLRMRQQGYRCIYNPMVTAVQYYEDDEKAPQALARVRDKYPGSFENDPFFNPNLSLDNEWFLGYRDFPVERQIPELKMCGQC